jgi:hypothetical protein
MAKCDGSYVLIAWQDLVTPTLVFFTRDVRGPVGPAFNDGPSSTLTTDWIICMITMVTATPTPESALTL